MKYLLALLMLVLTGPAHGAWVEDTVTFDSDTEEPKIIANGLTQFQDTLNLLVAENLTSPSRVKVKHFQGHIGIYHWENDSQCAVKDPSSIIPVQMSNAHADFYYEGDEKAVWSLDVILSKADPCDPSPRPPLKTRRYRKS